MDANAEVLLSYSTLDGVIQADVLCDAKYYIFESIDKRRAPPLQALQ